jgi:hypothetical protein
MTIAILVLAIIVITHNESQLVQGQNNLINNNSSISADICTRSNIPGQYEVILSDSIVNNPKALEDALSDLTQKVNSSGIKVVNVLENIGILIIKSSNQQLLDKVINNLRNDSRVADVEQSQYNCAF